VGVEPDADAAARDPGAARSARAAAARKADNVNPVEAIERAARLQQMGVEVRSPELEGEAARMRAFADRGGNREMRRSAQRAARRKGR
jgi:hypothetical protein